MKSCCFVLLLAVANAAVLHQQARVSPVQKVVQLLTDLGSKLTRDGEAEEKAYQEYTEWCKNGAQDKQFEIKTTKADIDDLTATIGKATSDIGSANTKIEELGGALSANDGDLKAATDIRKKEKDEFLKTETELMDTVDILDRAINILERKMKGSALMQAKVNTKDMDQLVQVLSTVVDAASLSLHDKQRLVALAQAGGAGASDADDANDELGAPSAEAYKSRGGSIIDVLEDLREKAESELSEARSQETNSRHNYDMLAQSLSDQIAADTKEMSESKTQKASAQEVKATSEGDLGVAKKDLADAEAALEEMSTSCVTAASDHDASVKSRAEELEALAAAKKAIVESTSGAEEQTYSFIQVITDDNHEHQQRTSTGSSLSTRADLANFEVVNMVRQLAKEHHSKALAQLASRIQAVIRYGSGAGEDPFAKVKALITDMIAKLQDEAGAEASHKSYCDKEMANTQEKLDDLKQSADGLSAKIDKKKALSVNLKGEVKQLQAELAELAKSQADMDAARREEHKVFLQTKTDLEQGLEGVRMALKVLREYYANDEAASLIQQPAAPTGHTKSDGAGSGIIGMLEVIESDFGKGLAQGGVDEDGAEAQYQRISQTNKITKATKDQDQKYKTKEAVRLDKATKEISSDLGSVQSELDAVLEYSSSIRAQCVAKPDSYEERKGRREAEVAGLKEALAILSGESFATLLQKRKARHA